MVFRLATRPITRPSSDYFRSDRLFPRARFDCSSARDGFLPRRLAVHPAL